MLVSLCDFVGKRVRHALSRSEGHGPQGERPEGGGGIGASATDWVFDLGAAHASDVLNITGNFTKGSGSAFRFDFGGSAQEGFTTAAGQLGITLDQSAPARLPMASLQAINSRLSALVVRRYCTRRGLVVAASTVPLGIGAVIGGSANFVAVRNLAKHADRFFAKLPYSSIEVEAREVGGMIGPGPRLRPA